jgi:hypothetical protein
VAVVLDITPIVLVLMMLREARQVVVDSALALLALGVQRQEIILLTEIMAWLERLRLKVMVVEQ